MSGLDIDMDLLVRNGQTLVANMEALIAANERLKNAAAQRDELAALLRHLRPRLIHDEDERRVDDLLMRQAL